MVDLSVEPGGTIPRRGPWLLRRRRLLRTLDEGAPLTLVTAPAGYGKSGLLATWAAEQPAGRTRWIEVDGTTSDAVEARLAHLGAGAPVTVLLDTGGAHRRPALHALVVDLVASADPDVRVVAAQRGPWPSLGPQPDVVAIGADELAFTPDEMGLLVREAADLDLTERQLDELAARTGGWAVGLGLFVAALRARREPDRALDALHGDEPHLAAYLRAEVIDAYPPEVRRFLRRSAALDVLAPSSCAAVLQDPLALATIEALRRDGTVSSRTTEPLRYHPLLLDLLRRDLHRLDPDDERELALRAAAHHEHRGELTLALGYLVRARAWDSVVDLVDREARPSFERAAAEELSALLEAIPPDARPDLVLRRGVLLTMLGRTRQAEEELRQLDSPDAPPGQRAVVDALRATWSFFDASPEATIRTATAALEAVEAQAAETIPDVVGMTPPVDLRAMATGSRGRAWWYLGDLDAARHDLEVIARQEEAYLPWRAHALSALAVMEAWSGHLSRAVELAADAIGRAQAFGLVRHPATIDAHLALAHVRRERGDRRAAEVHVDEALAAAHPTRRPVTLAIAAVEQACSSLARGDPERGLTVVAELRSRNEAPPPPIVEARLLTVEARLLLARGEPERAAALLVRRQPAGAEAVVVQLAVERDDLTAAQDALRSWRLVAGDARAELERDLWQAVVTAASGDRVAGLALGRQVVDRAGDEGHVQLFTDGGRSVLALLRSIRQESPTAYLGRLERVSASRLRVQEGHGLDLSRRELEILAFLPTPLSNAEIAERQYISLNTLKTHLRTIYRKLEVGTRSEAVRRAEELGLV